MASALDDGLDYGHPAKPDGDALTMYVVESLVPQLFSVGLTLNSALSALQDETAPHAARRVQHAVGQLDDTIKKLRMALIEDHLHDRRHDIKIV